MARNKDKCDGDRNKKSSDASHPWIPVWVALVPHLCGALDVVTRHVAALQEQPGIATNTHFPLLAAVGFVILPCSFSWWNAIRHCLAQRASPRGQVRRWLPPVIAAVGILWFIPFKFLSADAADETGSSPWLTVECGDQNVESISYFDVELKRGPRAANGSNRRVWARDPG